MTRWFVMAMLAACGGLSAGCDQVRKPELDAEETEQRGMPQVGAPITPGGSFTDLPPLPPPEPEPAEPGAMLPGR